MNVTAGEIIKESIHDITDQYQQLMISLNKGDSKNFELSDMLNQLTLPIQDICGSTG